MDEEIRQALTEVREMKKMCGNINMKLTNIVTQRGQDIKKKLEAEYKRGLKDGKQTAVGAAELREKLEYQRGLDDAWDIVKKIYLEGDCRKISGEYFNNYLKKHTISDAINMLKAYEQKQNDKIEVGDEVNWIGDCFIVTRIFQPHNMKEQCDGIDDDGCVYHDVLMDDLEKTGRHFDIGKILEEMKHE